MKKFFEIAALFAALGLAAFFSACSNTVSGVDTPPPAQAAKTYTVSFNANDGSQNPAKATQIFTAGTPQNLTSIADLGFKKDNFAFAGWALSSAASEAAYADKAEYTGNISITLYAVWTPIYAVTFDSKGGSEVAGQKVTSGQTASKPADPAKEHFNFAGWCSDENCQTPFDFASPITAPTTLYAKWSDLPVYAVTFDLDGGKYGASDSYAQNVEINQKAMRPASDPTKGDNVGADVTTKYAFDNWYADADCNTLFDFDATTISGATTVYAKWSETKYYAVKIASGIEHGSVSSDAAEHIAAGTLVTLAASPSAGYKFGAYTVTDADSNPVDVVDGKFTMPTSPVTVSASFIAIEYTITYGTPENGTLTADKAKATIGTTVTLTVSANDGYELKKLLVKDSGGADVSVTEVAAGASYTFTMPAANVIVTAAFRVAGITLEAIEAGAKVTFTNKASGSVTYRINGGDSQTIASGASKSITLTNVGDKISFYGDNATYASSFDAYSNIACDKDCYVYGNIMSLVDSANYENATTLKGSYTFYGLFSDNAHIKNKAGRDLLLPATTLAEECYRSMFSGCAGLASAPALPATTLADSCYESMFSGCASLASAPELPATKLADNCYESMFFGCASLASTPALPATKLAGHCYSGMFSGCASLTSAPELPATTLADSCYYRMFYGCTGLTSAPELPATTLASYCYDGMFKGCKSLTSVTCFAINLGSVTEWLDGVSSTGTFTGCVKWSRESINIPVGWTVSLTLDMKRRPLTLEAIEAGSIVTFANQAAGTVYYTVNSAGTREIAVNETKKISLSNAGDWVCFYGDNATYASSTDVYSNIACDKDCYVYGNIMSLVYSANYESAKKLTGKYTFYGLFKDNAHIKNKAGEDLLLPATTLASYCYNYMFYGCESLTSAPELSATTLKESCYYGMFRDCASLTSAPELPATKLSDHCYQAMFSGCAGLTSAPELPARWPLADSCYASMFSGCKSLASAPELPATMLASSCYDSMFSGCASLASAPELPATTLAWGCYQEMFKGCENLTSAPELPATTLSIYCYHSMFDGCASLASVTCLATDISAYGCTTDWLKGVAPTGTFKKAARMRVFTNGGWTSGRESGIPKGWTVVDYQE